MSLEVAEKWGFGMAPPKQKAQRERITACEVVLGILVTRNARTNPDQMLACLSIVKGLFNRVARQDQWDWFTVAGQFGYPSCRLAKTIADELATLRTAIRDGDDQ